MTTWLNIGCGPFRAPEPWINIDVVHVPGVIEPDFLVIGAGAACLHDLFSVTSEYVRTMDENSVDRIYLGHMLEHMSWPNDVERYVSQICQGLLVPGGQLMVVGPDVYRGLASVREGRRPVDFMETLLEDDQHFQDADHEWEEARHHWNCYEARLVRLLKAAGYVDVTAHRISQTDLADWPVVSLVDWQCAVSARSPM